MRQNLPKVGDLTLLVALCLFLVGFEVNVRTRKQRQLRRRAERGERETLKDINTHLDLEQRLREERRP